MRGHPALLLVLALGLAAGAAVLMTWEAGWRAVGDALWGVQPGWLALAVAVQFVALAAYIPAYRVMAALDDGLDVPVRAALCLVLVGFAAFAPLGGFVYDQQVWAHFAGGRHRAGARVLGLGALEYALLAPAAWIAAVVLLAHGHERVQGAVLVPWALCVPAGAGLALLALRHRRRLTADGRRPRIERALIGLCHLLDLRREPRQALLSAAGIGGYWLAEGVALYAAGRSVGLSLGLGPLVLGLGTGFALTRRSMPLAGAGATMLLMSLALHWVGAALPAAVAATAIYSAAGLVLPSVVALPARHALESGRHLGHPA